MPPGGVAGDSPTERDRDHHSVHVVDLRNPRGDGRAGYYVGMTMNYDAACAIASRHQFPTLAPATNPANVGIGLAAGLGLVTFRDTSGPAWFKGGHNDWTGNMVVCLETGRRCLVLVANDVRAERIFPELTQLILGETRMPWAWEYDWFTGSSDPRRPLN